MHAGDKIDIPKYEIEYTVEAFYLCQVMSWFFYIPPQILDRRSTPTINSPGLLLSVLPKSTGKIQRLVPETLSRFPRPLSLEKFYVARWIDYQMAG